MTREEELAEVPMQKPDKSRWPKGVRVIGIDELDCLGIDKNRTIYWNGKKLQVRRTFSFSRWQAVGAFLVGSSVAITGLVSIWQWGCKLAWLGQNYCPPPGS